VLFERLFNLLFANRSNIIGDENLLMLVADFSNCCTVRSAVAAIDLICFVIFNNTTTRAIAKIKKIAKTIAKITTRICAQSIDQVLLASLG